MRKRKRDDNLRVYVRLTEDELIRLDEFVRQRNEDGSSFTRAGLVRHWICKELYSKGSR